MNTYTIKPSKSVNYIWLFFGLFFLIATIGILYVIVFLIPATANLPKSTYSVVLLLLGITMFSFYKMKSQNQLASLILTQENITNLKTNQVILWKNIADLYFFNSGKVVGIPNNLAYRVSENESFTPITAMQYSFKDLEVFESFHLQPRIQKVLENIRNGETEKFYSLPLSNTFKQAFNINTNQFLKFDADKILLNNKELVYKDKRYLLEDLSVISINSTGKYQLKTNFGVSILEFNKLNLISCEVFRNVINQLVK